MTVFQTAKPEEIRGLQAGSPVSLDPTLVPVDRDGIRDFFWPVAVSDKERVRDHFQKELAALLRDELAKGDGDWQLLRVLLYEILNALLTAYQAVAARRRCAAAGRRLLIPDGFRLTRALQAGEAPPLPPLIAALEAGLPRPHPLVMPVRAARNLLMRDAFRRQRVRQIHRGRNIVAVGAAPFMQAHAGLVEREEGRRVLYCSLWEWFAVSKKDRQEVAGARPARSDCIDKTVALAADAFRHGDEDMPAFLRAWFADWIAQASALVRFHTERLRARPERLPRVLWYGSMNNVWMRMLRAAVKEAGGRTLGHDHGCGVGLYPNRGEYGGVLDLCDEYVAYSPLLARAYARRMDDIAEVLPSAERPVFTGRPDLSLGPPKSPHRARPSGEPRRGGAAVMYLARPRFGERNSGLNCLAADMSVIDWQARLFGRLREWGYGVLCKLHPEYPFPLPEALTRGLGVAPVTGYVEDCFSAADIFLFDFMSSAYRTLAFTDKPIVFVDFGQGDMAPEVREVLERRCAVVPGWYDEANRARVEWSGLRRALTLSKERSRDRTCARALYGDGE